MFDYDILPMVVDQRQVTFLGVNGFDRSLDNTLWSFSWPAFSIFIWYLIQFLVNYLNVPFHVQTTTYFGMSNTMHARGFSNRKLGFERMFKQSFEDMLWKWKICCMSNSTLRVTSSRRPNYCLLPKLNLFDQITINVISCLL